MIVCLCDLEAQAVYWQAITEENVVFTGKGFRCNVPLSQTLDESAVPSLTSFLTPIVSHDRYTIFRTDDVSHDLARNCYIRSTELSLAPFECQEVDDRFRCFIFSVHDLSIYCSEKGVERWPSHTRLRLCLEARKRALKDYKELEYELKKIR